MTKIQIRRRLNQLHLFRPRPKVPTWKTLPVDVRQKVTSLVARMLREHRAGLLGIRSKREGPDE